MRPSRNNVWKSMPGWCTDVEGDYLHLFATTSPNGAIIVDLGTYMGKSAIALGLGCLASGARVLTVDHFEGNPEHTVKPHQQDVLIWLERVDKDLLDVVTVVPEDAIAFARDVTKPIYAFYVDTEHNYQVVIDTFAAWWPKLTSKGHVLFHDARNTGWREVAEAVVAISERWPMKELPGADSIRHFRKKL